MIYIASIKYLTIADTVFEFSFAKQLIYILKIVKIDLNNVKFAYHNGTCIMIESISDFNAINIRISNCICTTSVPGIRILNDKNLKFNSFMNITNSFFTNNSYSSNISVDSYGCNLELYNIYDLYLENNTFVNNYVGLVKEIHGGTSLFYSNSKGKVLIKSCIFKDNVSSKCGILIEFIGLNLTIISSQFLNNSETSDSYLLFADSAWINGISQTFIMKDCNFIIGFVYYGIYTFLEFNYLNIVLDNINVIKTFSHYTNVITENDFSNNRTVLWSNSLFADNINDNNAFIITILLFGPKVRHSSVIRNVQVINSIATIINWVPIVAVSVSFSHDNLLSISNCSFINNTDKPSILFLIVSIKHWNQIVFNNSYIQGNYWTQQMHKITQSIYNESNNIYINNSAIMSRYMLYSKNSYITYSNVSFESSHALNFLYFIECYTIQLVNVIFSNSSTKNIGFYLKQIESLNLINFTLANFSASYMTNIFDISYLLTDQNSLINFSIFNISQGKNIFNLAEITNLEISNLSINVFHTPYCFSITLNSQLTINNFSLSNFIENRVLNDGIAIYSMNSNISLYNFKYHHTNSFYQQNKIYVLNSQFSIYNSECYNINIPTNNYFLESFSSQILMENLTIFLINNLFYIEESSLYVLKSKFMNCNKTINESNSYIILLNNPFINLINSSFLNLMGPYSSIYIENSEYNNKSIISIQTCLFYNNIARKSFGGSLHLKNSFISLNENIFISNIAIRGGGIYFDCLISDRNLCHFYLNSNIFISNIAQIDGAGYKWQFIRPITNNNTFFNNSAQYSPDFSGYFCRLGIQVSEFQNILFNSFITNSSDYYKLDNVKIDEFIPRTIEIFPLDSQNQRIYENLGVEIVASLDSAQNLTNSSKCINSSFQPHIYGFLIQNQNENLTFEFKSGIKVISCPGSLLYLSLSCSSITIIAHENYLGFNNSANEFLENDNYNFVIPLQTLECVIGEIYNPILSTCDKCPQNTFSVNILDTKCFSCPIEAICLGGDQIFLYENYWRSSVTSIDIYDCDKELHSCPGGYNSTCNENYEGLLCNSCKRDENTIYYKSFTGKCEECPNILVIIILTILIYIILIIILLFILYVFNKHGLDDDKKFVIKILIYYFHSWVITQTYNINLQNSDLEGYITMINQFSKLSRFWISIDCLNKDSNSMLNNAVSMLFIYLIFVLFYYLSKYSFLKKITSSKDSLILIYYILYPSIICLFYESLVCQNIENEYYLYRNSNITCFDSSYLRWMILCYLPNMILFGLVVPFKILKDSYEKVENEKKQLYFNIFDIGCKNPKQWETFIYFKNISLIFIIYSNYQSSLKIITMLFIMMISHLLEISYFGKAFKKKNYNYIFSNLKLLIIMNVYFLLWLSDGFNDTFAKTIFGINISINLIFILHLVLFYFKAKLKKIIPINLISKKIGKKWNKKLPKLF